MGETRHFKCRVLIDIGREGGGGIAQRGRSLISTIALFKLSLLKLAI